MTSYCERCLAEMPDSDAKWETKCWKCRRGHRSTSMRTSFAGRWPKVAVNQPPGDKPKGDKHGNADS